VTEYSPLQSEIKRLIKTSGPMPVWRYMELCLTHPEFGYYVSRDPLGREGDFTTAPEVSQMFGELLGLWAASVWKAIGSPPLLRLIELGPGRGTMMAGPAAAVPGAQHPSGRDQSGAARKAEVDAVGRARHRLA
jgi:SAM-dependent MidA family methyltransferase